MIICKECKWIGTKNQMLKGKHPFEDNEIITGCPNCKEINSLRTKCMVEGCKEISTCISTLTGQTKTTKNGYFYCYKHYENEK